MGGIHGMCSDFSRYLPRWAWSSLFKIILFENERMRERQWERERKQRSTVHFPNVLSDWNWALVKPGAKDSTGSLM